MPSGNVRGNPKWGGMVRVTREAAKIEREVVAKKIGYTPESYAAIERGGKRLSPEAYASLCKLLPNIKKFEGAPIGLSAGKRSKSTSKVRRMNVKRNPSMTTHAKKTKKKKKKAQAKGGKRASLALLHTLLSLFKDRKALTHLKGVLVAAAADSLSLEELSQLLNA